MEVIKNMFMAGIVFSPSSSVRIFKSFVIYTLRCIKGDRRNVNTEYRTHEVVLVVKQCVRSKYF